MGHETIAVGSFPLNRSARESFECSFSIRQCSCKEGYPFAQLTDVGCNKFIWENR